MGAAAAAAVPAGRGQHAPLPRSVAAELKPRRRTCTSEAIHSNPNRAGSTQIASKMRFRSFPKMHFRSFPKSTKTGLEHEAVRQKCVSEASQNQQKMAWNTELCVKNAFPKLPKINKNWPGTLSRASKMRV